MTRRKSGAAANGNGKHLSILAPTPSHSNGKSKPILIAGGAGFVGSNLAHRLLSAGHKVRLLDNLSRAGVERNLRWLIETHGDLVDIEVPDLRNLSIIKQAVKDASQVFHFAAQVAVTSSLVDPIEDFEINARGTLNVLEAIRAVRNPPPLVFTSTNKVYGNLVDLEFIKDDASLAICRFASEASARTGHSISIVRTAVQKARPTSMSWTTRAPIDFPRSCFA